MKKVLLILIGIVILAGLAPAETPPGRFLSMYWIKGTVTNPEHLAGRQIYLHGLNFAEDKVIKVNVAPNGVYKVNAMELIYWYADDVHKDDNDSPVFLLSVVRGTDQEIADINSELAYGAFTSISVAEEVDFDQGWVERDITLYDNEEDGPVGPQKDEGMVVASVTKIEDQPIAFIGATVLLDQGNEKESDDDGLCFWFSVEPGEHDLYCNPEGYIHVAPSTADYFVAVEANKIHLVGFSLEEGEAEGLQIIGSIPVTIEKVDVLDANNEPNPDGIDDSIKLTWDIDPSSWGIEGELPVEYDVIPFILLGDGTGLYTNQLQNKHEVFDDQTNVDVVIDVANFGQYKGKWLIFPPSHEEPIDDEDPPIEEVELSDVLNIDIDEDFVNGVIILKNLVNGQSVDGKMYYDEMYFCFPVVAGQGEPTILALESDFAEAHKVGKLDYDFEQGLNLFANSFEKDDLSLLSIFGNQLYYDPQSLKGDQIQYFTPNGYKVAEYIGNNNFKFYSDSFEIEEGKAFWILLREEQAAPLTVVGSVKGESYTTTLNTGLSLIGSPFPVNYGLGQVGFDPSFVAGKGDQIQQFVNLGQGAAKYNVAEFDGAVWKYYQGADQFTFQAGKGCWYLRRDTAGQMSWNFNLQ